MPAVAPGAYVVVGVGVVVGAGVPVKPGPKMSGAHACMVARKAKPSSANASSWPTMAPANLSLMPWTASRMHSRASSSRSSIAATPAPVFQRTSAISTSGMHLNTPPTNAAASAEDGPSASNSSSAAASRGSTKSSRQRLSSVVTWRSIPNSSRSRSEIRATMSTLSARSGGRHRRIAACPPVTSLSDASRVSSRSSPTPSRMQACSSAPRMSNNSRHVASSLANTASTSASVTIFVGAGVDVGSGARVAVGATVGSDVGVASAVAVRVGAAVDTASASGVGVCVGAGLASSAHAARVRTVSKARSPRRRAGIGLSLAPDTAFGILNPIERFPIVIISASQPCRLGTSSWSRRGKRPVWPGGRSSSRWLGDC